MKVQRILVAVDDSPGSRAAAEAAAQLAARLQAELVGLFVEDIQLLHAAALPLAREVDSLTAGRRLPQGEAVRRQLRLQAARARDQLRRIADHERLAWSFRTTRGTVPTEIAAASEDAEIVSLGPMGWSPRRQKAIGAAAQAVLAKKQGCTLLLHRTAQIRPPILLIFDGSPTALQALRLGGKIAAGGHGGALQIVLVGNQAKLIATVNNTVDDTEAYTIAGSVAGPADPLLTQWLANAEAGLTIVPVNIEETTGRSLQEVVELVNGPILLVS